MYNTAGLQAVSKISAIIEAYCIDSLIKQLVCLTSSTHHSPTTTHHTPNSGLCDGMGAGSSSKAALMRQGLKEMAAFCKEFDQTGQYKVRCDNVLI